MTAALRIQPRSESRTDLIQAELVEEFLERLQAGETLDPSEFAAQYPEHAEALRQLLPALQMMAELSRSASRDRSSLHLLEAISAPELGVLGDFRILREVGRGGMGVVYEAEQLSLHRRVALKVLPLAGGLDPRQLQRFKTEAQAAALLHHTNIVPIHAVGCERGVHYYAMQFIDGQTLAANITELRAVERLDEPTQTVSRETSSAAASRLFGEGEAPAELLASPPFAGAGPTPRSGGEGPRGEMRGMLAPGARQEPRTPMPSTRNRTYLRNVARLGVEAAEALEHAHQEGVIHRDIKPSNLLLDAQGNAWVTDFGLAKLVEGDDLSQSHDLVGTLRFMAPERFRGVNDRRGDIYALGATLYEMLALRPAFDERDQVRLIDQIAHQAPAPLRQHDRRIPRDLETIVMKALSKEPKDRCDKAGELRDELRRFLEGRPTRWRRVGPVEQFRRWCKRNRGLAAATITAAALTAVLAIGSTIAAWIYRGQLTQTQKAERAAQVTLGNSLVSEGAALQRTELIGQRFTSLDRLRQAAQILGADPAGRKRLPEIRNLAIAALGLTDLRLLRERDLGNAEFCVDAALERYAVMEPSGGAVVRRLDDDRELVRLSAPDRLDFWAAGCEFSPDGELLVARYGVWDGGPIARIWHLGRRELLLSLSPRGWGGLAFHPDGRRLAYRAGGGYCNLGSGRAPRGPAAAVGLGAHIPNQQSPTGLRS
jgi:serine/threonine protein kinase